MDYDEPEILPYLLSRNCLINAEPRHGQALGVIVGRATPSCDRTLWQPRWFPDPARLIPVRTNEFPQGR